METQYKFEQQLATLRDMFKDAIPIIDEILAARAKQVMETEHPTDVLDWDIEKVHWEEGRQPRTWFASAEMNKDNVDFKHMWEAMVKAKEAKGNPDPFYFWLKGNQFMWFNQSGSGVYRRVKGQNKQ